MTDSRDTMIRTDDEENWAALRAHLDAAMDYANAGQWDRSIASCRAGIEMFPANPESYYLLAIIGYKLGDEGQALGMAEKAHELDPDTREYTDLLAAISARVGRLTDAVYYGKLAETCEKHPYLQGIASPEFSDLKHALQSASLSRHSIEGQRFFNETNYLAALREFKAEIAINPGNVEALIFLTRTTLALGMHTQAVGAAQSALHYAPANAMARALMARALVSLGRDAEAIAVAREAISLSAGDAEVYQMAMHALQSCPIADLAVLKDIAVAFDKDFARANEVETQESEAASGAGTRQARIGMLSNCYHRSPLMEYVASWFTLPPDASVQIRSLQYSLIRDTVTTLCRNGSTEWREIYGIDPFTLGLTLKGEELDVLVDITDAVGETCGTVAGLRPAAKRVGVSALPEPGMMPGITHVLSDEGLAAGDRKALLPGQDLMTISGTLFARLPFKTLPQNSVAPVVESGVPTFGAVAGLPELSPECALQIAAVLRAVPNARLMLFKGSEISEHARMRIREQFMAGGVIDRVYFVEDETSDELETTLQRLEASVSGPQWAEVDVFLDTYPINGRKQIWEALWSGVPVVTRRGPRRASSVGASMVSAAGHPEWIAGSEFEFVETAVRMVADAAALAETRKNLQASIGKSFLFDPARTAREVRRVLVEAARRS